MKRDLKLFVGYMFCAGVATFVDMGFLYTLIEGFKIWYFYAAIAAYGAGMITNFGLNRIFNFKSKSKKIIQQGMSFIVVALIGLALNQGILYVLIEHYDLWYVYAKLVSVTCVMFWSFYGHKKITFSLFE